MALTEGEFKALISLLDDNDSEVISHVTGKLAELGIDGIPLLESAWEFSDNEIIQARLEDLIGKIQFENLLDLFKNWIKNGGKSIYEGACLVARFHYPELDEEKLSAQISRIVHTIWIHLNPSQSPMEEVHTLNRIFFGEFDFKGNREVQPEVDLGYINTILDTRRGNSIGIGILYLIIAEKLDLSIYGVNLPYHFVMCSASRMLTDEELKNADQERLILFYINPLLEGIPFSRIEITRYLEQTKIKPKNHYYSPCHNFDVIKSLIYNQMACYEQNGEAQKAQKMKLLYDLFDNHLSEDFQDNDFSEE